MSFTSLAFDSGFDDTENLLLVLDARGAVESVNAAYRRATGWSELEAQTLAEAMWQGPCPETRAERVRLEQTCRNGRAITVDWMVSPLVDAEGRLLRLVCNGRDLQQQQRIADQQREHDKLRTVVTLTAGLAHDFNNLLGSINGLAELCELQAEPGSRQARNLGRIRLAGDRAAELVRQMLDYARQTPKTLQLVSTTRLAGHASALIRASLPPQVWLSMQVGQHALMNVDFVQMEQVLLNLARNAAHAMRRGGGQLQIVFDCAEPKHRDRHGGAATPHPDGWVRLRVIDEGDGMTPDVMGRIFDPFFTTKAVGEGTGLGLSAVHGIVASHGGLIEVDSKPGRGTTFSIFVPREPAGLD